MKVHYRTVDGADDEYGLSVDSYLGEPNLLIEEETELQSSSDVLNVIDHLGQSQLVDMIFKAFSRVIDKNNLLLTLSTQISFREHLKDLIVASHPHLHEQDQRMLLNKWFLLQVTGVGIDSNPADFATLSLEAMLMLQRNDNPNLVYEWGRCLCNDEGKPSLDLNQMPFGMLQYIIEFFPCTHVAQVCIIVCMTGC